jgi:hypothetical protein
MADGFESRYISALEGVPHRRSRLGSIECRSLPNLRRRHAFAPAVDLSPAKAGRGFWRADDAGSCRRDRTASSRSAQAASNLAGLDGFIRLQHHIVPGLRQFRIRDRLYLFALSGSIATKHWRPGPRIPDVLGRRDSS